ncbi:MAG: GNAT family N-acetyltransferase [Nitrospirae bacterium]|nr:MAG: GNAT family N-acetyltransferase [Nitrospirota bacterium]
MAPSHVRPLFLPPSLQDFGWRPAGAGYLILRDGTTALIRPAGPDDQPSLQAFVDRLSSEAKRHRFFSETVPSPSLIAALCDTSDPHALMTLLVTRTVEGAPCIIAAGSYMAKDDRTAEVAMAVDGALHGKGLGTLLLEQLALLAVRQGYVRLWAVTHADNLAMREVFRESGFTTHEALEGGDMEVELSLLSTAAGVERSELRERLATTASLRPFFHPRSVAVVGASRDPASIGGRLLAALRAASFAGALYPVNPQTQTIAGFQAYPSVRAIPDPVDLAVIAVPPPALPVVVEDCAARGVRALVVITAGFAEVGAEGRARQDRLLGAVRGSGMRMVGPNCLGLINTDPSVRLNASFSPIFPPAGGVAMASQSGALGLAVLAAAKRLRLGLSTFVSVGNKADVSSNDLLQYWEEDPRTDVILLYQESFGNPRRFARIARRVARRKPIVAVKGGRTSAGRRAAGSHTAALAASDVAVDALFHQAGVIRADTLEELFALAVALGAQPLPKGRRVAIVTNAGGPAILCADRCEAGGLLVSAFSERTQAQLASFLPPTAGLANPVDLIASARAEDFRQALTVIAGSGEVDALIVLYVSAGALDPRSLAQAIRDGVASGTDQAPLLPVLVCWMGEEEQTSGPDELARLSIPVYEFPETPALVLSKTAAYADWRAQPLGMIPDFDDLDLEPVRRLCRRAIEERGIGWLSAEETKVVLTSIRLPVAPGGLARTMDEAASMARHVGFPVAMKLASRTLVHKTEVGGVILNLQDMDAVRRAFARIRDRLALDNRLDAMDGVIVQPMVSGGVELMVGVTHDPLFGPLIAFGLGGIHVEILRDVCFRITPLTDRDAREMVRSIRGFPLLEGYRGHPPADLEAIEEVLLRVSRLVEEIPEITEVDLNPLFALPPGEGCRIVDARIRVEPVLNASPAGSV